MNNPKQSNNRSHQGIVKLTNFAANFLIGGSNMIEAMKITNAGRKFDAQILITARNRKNNPKIQLITLINGFITYLLFF